jgi:hypothetical protein
MMLSARLWTLLSLIMVALLLATASFAADDGITDVSIISITPFAGQTVSHELAFVATRELPSAEIRVEYPIDFHLSQAKLPLSSSRTGQLILFSVPRVISAGERVVLRVDDIINPTTPATYRLLVSTGPSTAPVLEPLSIQGADGAVTLAWVDVTNLLPGGTAGYTVNFIATNGLIEGETIRVQYPMGFNVSGATVPPNDVLTLQAVSGQTITYRVSRSYRAGEFFATPVRTEGIVNPPIPGTGLVKVSTSSDPTQVSIPYQVKSSGSVRGVSVQVASITTGQSSSYTVNFRTSTGLPVGATVSLEFPPGFTPGVQSSPDYTVENVSGQTVTLRMLKAVNASVYHPAEWLTTPEAGEVSISTTGIVNPSEAGTYYFKLWTSNDTEKVSLPIFIARPTLSISFAGPGNGSVNGGYSCQSPGLCSFTTTEARVTLIPTAAAGSVFAGWSGACTAATGNCVVDMDQSKSVTATFNIMDKDKVRILSKTYPTLAAAFAEAASGTVEAMAAVFPETLNVTRPTRFKGGFDAQFTSNKEGFTTLDGTLTIGAGGSLRAERLVIR